MSHFVSVCVEAQTGVNHEWPLSRGKHLAATWPRNPNGQKASSSANAPHEREAALSAHKEQNHRKRTATSMHACTVDAFNSRQDRRYRSSHSNFPTRSVLVNGQKPTTMSAAKQLRRSSRKNPEQVRIDPKSLPTEVLRLRLQGANLSSTGRRQQLIQRLENHLQNTRQRSPTPADPDPPAPAARAKTKPRPRMTSQSPRLPWQAEGLRNPPMTPSHSTRAKRTARTVIATAATGKHPDQLRHAGPERLRNWGRTPTATGAAQTTTRTQDHAGTEREPTVNNPPVVAARDDAATPPDDSGVTVPFQEQTQLHSPQVLTVKNTKVSQKPYSLFIFKSSLPKTQPNSSPPTWQKSVPQEPQPGTLW